MKTYEMLYILDSSVADEAKEAIVQKFDDLIASLNGKVISTEKQGVKKLAYPISYKSEGYYVLTTFEAEGSAIKEIDRIAGLTAEVLRRVITVK